MVVLGRMFWVLCVALLLFGCRNEAPPSATPQDALEAPTCGAPTSSRYSPFVIALSGEGPFDRISFKDVGMGRDLSPESDPMLEAIAESVALHISTESDLGYQPEVQFSTSIMDPSNHCDCGSSHLYVDLWRVEGEQAQWGYSLWSGCGAEDRFAWQQTPVANAKEDDLVETVDPLTRSIVRSLSTASQRGCFQKSC